MYFRLNVHCTCLQGFVSYSTILLLFVIELFALVLRCFFKNRVYLN